MSRIIFGINVPYQSSKVDWEATEAKRKELMAEGKPFWHISIRTPCIRVHDELSFELCDICGSQVHSGRAKRKLTTCCPAHNARKWDAINGLVIERERNLVGKRPTSFWQTISYECFKRDNFTCTRCNKTREELYRDRELERMLNGKVNLNWHHLDYSLHCHHHIPIKDGGTNKLENLRTRCGKCHKLEESHLRTKKGQTKFGGF